MAETPVLPQAEYFYLWPENLPAWRVFQACHTQWRVGQDGREGLDYAAVQVVMQAHRIRPRQRRQRFAELQVMESAALQEWAAAQAKNQ